jgi:hypothetical protein
VLLKRKPRRQSQYKMSRGSRDLQGKNDRP